MKRAKAKKLVDIKIHDLRDFSTDKYRKVDDRPFGGGPGMVFKIEPLAKALGSILRIKNQEVRSKKKTLVILFSASAKQFTQKMAGGFAKNFSKIVMIAGHYEGVDERIKSLILNSGFSLLELSVGPYVLTGGELPAMIVIDAVSRHVPGFLGKAESLEEKRHGIGMPVYTRPEVFGYNGKKYKVPKVLLSGDHKKIESWRKKHQRLSKNKPSGTV